MVIIHSFLYVYERVGISSCAEAQPCRARGDMRTLSGAQLSGWKKITASRLVMKMMALDVDVEDDGQSSA